MCRIENRISLGSFHRYFLYCRLLLSRNNFKTPNMTLSHARAKRWPLLQAVLRQHPPQFLNVQKLPPEVVGVILTYLTEPDQVCFSLSCKYLFACFHFFLQAHDLQLAQLLPPEKRQKLCPNVEKRPRIKLLHQLENSRWKYCSACWSLHPHSAWQDPRWTWRSYRKPCCFECQPLHGQNECMAYAGEGEVCPASQSHSLIRLT
jgi:hypothetical protein